MVEINYYYTNKYTGERLKQKSLLRTKTKNGALYYFTQGINKNPLISDLVISSIRRV